LTNNRFLQFRNDGWIADIVHIVSPNFDARPPGTSVDLIVLHCISLPPGEFGGSGITDLFSNRLRPHDHPFYASIANLRVSCHFLVRRGGELVQFVSCDQRAWHAGESQWEGRAHCNDFSIGIELEGTDYGLYESRQYDSVAELTTSIRRRYPIRGVMGHSDVAPGRKSDPGPYFDWRYYVKLVEEGNGRGSSEPVRRHHKS
jgi:N-acetyl-anhydromuramoyl-L-alanine amidase